MSNGSKKSSIFAVLVFLFTIATIPMGAEARPQNVKMLVVGNDAGGVITVIDRYCPDRSSLLAFIGNEFTGVQYMGCAQLLKSDGRIIIRWDDGDVRTYPVDRFEFMETVIDLP